MSNREIDSDEMTLRDYFAAKAMQSTLCDTDLRMSKEKIAEWAYQMADAMMEARK
jgi:hypothetical protein